MKARPRRKARKSLSRLKPDGRPNYDALNEEELEQVVAHLDRMMAWIHRRRGPDADPDMPHPGPAPWVAWREDRALASDDAPLQSPLVSGEPPS